MILLLEKSVLSIENIEKCKAEFLRAFGILVNLKPCSKSGTSLLDLGFGQF